MNTVKRGNRQMSATSQESYFLLLFFFLNFDCKLHKLDYIYKYGMAEMIFDLLRSIFSLAFL